MLKFDNLCLLQADSDGEEKAGDSSRETLDQSCEHAKEQLTNSIRQQWRKLRNHMEKLDSQGTHSTVKNHEMQNVLHIYIFSFINMLTKC